jgi:hypothetical protein
VTAAAFESKIVRFWRLRRAIDAYREAVQQLEQDFYRELRPPCRRCKQWPCVCNKENK